ncbi:MAG: SHOCT domain-containing protein [Anaerolineae bacterium]|nr:SHOCT domain-containing protein [Anaerolineae bacterium]
MNVFGKNPLKVFITTFTTVMFFVATLAVLPMVMLPNFIAPLYSFLCPDWGKAHIEVTKYVEPGSVSYTPNFYCISPEGVTEPMGFGRALIGTALIGIVAAFVIAVFYSLIAWWGQENNVINPPPKKRGDSGDFIKRSLGASKDGGTQGLLDILSGLNLASLLVTDPDKLKRMTDTKIIINGKEHASIDDLPAEQQEAYKKAMRIFIDEDGDKIPDILQKGGLAQITSAFTQADPQEKLEKLKKLLDAGLISQQDYDDKKAEILSRM